MSHTGYICKASVPASRLWLSTVAHKMLPLFLQINAATCAASLEWLEGRRGMNDYSDEFHDHVATVLAEAEKVVVAAERL